MVLTNETQISDPQRLQTKLLLRNLQEIYYVEFAVKLQFINKGKVMSNRKDKGSGIVLKKWSTYWGKSREVGKPTVKLKWPESNYCQSQTKQNVAVNLKAS